MKNKDQRILASIVLGAILLRLLYLWIGRPEFVGWFNHTYYFYVQVRSLLQDGSLAFADMPLLFYIYAAVAKLLMIFGLELDNAIVSSTRLLMSIIPSLIPIPIYGLIKRVNRPHPLPATQWVLIVCAALLPLSLSHMPEFLQKNALGLLLLASLFYFAHKLFEEFRSKDAFIGFLLCILIVLTHFGTMGAMIVYSFAIFVACLILNRNFKQNLTIAAFLALLLIISLLSLYFFDLQRFERIFHYIGTSMASSLLGLIFSPDSDTNLKLLSAAGTVIPLALAGFFYRIYSRNRADLPKEDSILWLSSIIFCYLLVLPVWDHHLAARLSLFIGIPLLVIFAFNDKIGFRKRHTRIVVIAAAAVGILAVGFGEFMSLKFHNRDKDEAFADLMRMQDQVNLGANDLVITKNGAEHICNWFLGVKAGVITSLQRSDFKKYDNIFVLNPIEGSLNFQGIANKNADAEADRYLFMLRNIPKPDGVAKLFESRHIELFRLEAAPDDWRFDDEGYWVSYGEW